MSDLYQICQCLDEPKRVFTLTLDELGFLAVFASLGLILFGSAIAAIAGGAVGLFLAKTLKGSQGPWWLMYLCFWYLPLPFFRLTPASYKRALIG